MKNTLLLSVFAVACVPTGKDTADTSTDIVDTDTDTDIVEPKLGAAVDWGDDAVSLTIENGSEEAEYTWGIAETADSTDPWTGEDCYGGYELGDGSLLSFCHPVAVDGGMLAYGASPGDIVEGATTVFGGANFLQTLPPTSLMTTRLAVLVGFGVRTPATTQTMERPALSFNPIGHEISLKRVQRSLHKERSNDLSLFIFCCKIFYSTLFQPQQSELYVGKLRMLEERCCCC